MNYRITSIGFSQWANTRDEAEKIANEFCEKNYLFARKGYPIICQITYNGNLVSTIKKDGAC